MHGHGIAGALRSVGRWLRFLLAFAPIALCVQHAKATLITATVTGTVTSGSDATGVFGAPGSLAGDPYTLVYTVDDSQGSGTRVVSGPVPGAAPIGSNIGATDTSNPVTAVLTIGGGSYSFGTLSSSAVSSNVSRTIGANGNTGFNLSEIYGVANTGGAASLVTGVSFNNPPITPNYLWSSPLNYSPASTPANGGDFSLLHYNVNSVTGQQTNVQSAGGVFLVSNITISGPSGGTGGGGGGGGGGGFGSPTSAACIADVSSNMTPHPQTFIPSLSPVGSPRDTLITATFMPSVGLSQTETDCGVTSFNWHQTMTPTAPSPYYTCDNSGCSMHTQVVPNVTYDDPPINGWDYCNLSTTNRWKIPGIFGGALGCDTNPYYINPATAGPNLMFMDSPSDPCLLNPDGTDSSAWLRNPTYRNGFTVQQRCNVIAPAAGELDFKTTLIGVTSGGAVPLPYTFTWTDTFNGDLPSTLGGIGMGGISTPGTDIPVDPSSGEGGITILSVNDVPVPEPSSTLVFAVGLTCVLFARCKSKIVHL